MLLTTMEFGWMVRLLYRLYEENSYVYQVRKYIKVMDFNEICWIVKLI